MKKAELKKMDVKKLQEQITAMRKELFELRLSAASTHIKDNSQFKKLRTNIARALTYVRQKEQD